MYGVSGGCSRSNELLDVWQPNGRWFLDCEHGTGALTKGQFCGSRQSYTRRTMCQLIKMLNPACSLNAEWIIAT